MKLDRERGRCQYDLCHLLQTLERVVASVCTELTGTPGALSDRISTMSSRRNSFPAGREACSDCGQRARQGTLTHAPTCPTGLGVDRTMENDRAFFNADPGAVHRCRPMTSEERTEFSHRVDDTIPDGALIHVRRLDANIRTRQLYVLASESRVPEGTIGFWGHPTSFDRDPSRPFGQSQTLSLPGFELEVRLFALPANAGPLNLGVEIEGLGIVTLGPGAALPVATEVAVADLPPQ